MTEEWQAPERYSLRKTVFLHLAPGVPFTLAFLPAARLMNRAGGSTYLALLLCIPLLLVCEVGVLIVERKRINWSWRSIIVPRGSRRVSILDILLSVAAIYATAQMAGALAIPSRTAILRAMANWLPPWAIFDGILEGISPYTLWLGLFLSGLVASIVEELYFRALLMPRIPVSGRWAPAVNAALHSICHFYTPWNYLVFFLAFLPLAYYVRLRGNLLPTIITHILFNSVGVILVLAGLRLPFS
ncbi:MAG: CPBP family intramembrane glutamic endopeptidase [Chloroflexota bacterium]|nr:CPBP family intramembrane glutamic endopeptidase [Chloroflexota bacterium]